MSRRTIANTATVSGIGLHMGVDCTLTFRPGASGSGILFRRIDIDGTPEIPATADAAVLTDRRTQLGSGQSAVHTVEHVLAAVAALGLDDLVIELDAPEPPIADGSAQPFLEALSRAGEMELPGKPDYVDLRHPVRVQDGGATYEAHPSPRLELEVAIDFPHPLIGRQQGCWRIDRDVFASELASARTFGFVHEVETLRGMGLIKGASTGNAVVLDDTGVVDNELRWADEFVRHKAMDCVGDLALAGGRVRARVIADRPSHRGTILLVREMRRAMVASRNGESAVFEIEDIMRVLPHRYPFLLVDRVLEMEEDRRIVGMKNVTINEPFFQGHFPGHPIMPGVLIIEAMAQVGGMLLMRTIPDPENKVVYFTSLNNVKWRRPVRPGDQLIFELDLLQVRGMMCKMKGVAKVDGEIVAEAEMGAMVRDK
jgi:UDP-3-O-[3-hydroxymyristoyl] N-acetylglucosamine deacetylase / 3-hydroxyacyl-[acyl-carrier-protein] dehydratase